MTFGEAIVALKQGEWVQRSGWNGKNMHIYLEDARNITMPAGVFKGQTRRHEAYICMFTAQGNHQPGWLASQPDMLAEDWQIVSPA